MPQKHSVSDQQPSLRHYVSTGACSAFGKLARPDEDWTKLSDLAARRRVQNRIAQRNYRNKIKHKKKSLDGSGTSYSAESARNNFSRDSKDNVDLPLTHENDGATFHHITIQSQAFTHQACTAPSSNGIPLVLPLALVVTTAYSVCKIDHVPNIQQG